VKVPRLRLRTALFLVALVGTILGIAVNLHRSLAAREAAIRAVDKIHGTYGVKITGPAWFRTIVLRLGGNERMFYDPKRVSFGPLNSGYDPSHPIRDTDIAELSDDLALFSNLEHLDLQGNGQLTDRCIAFLPKLPHLRRIDLEGTKVTESAITYLRRRYPGCAVTRSRP
jgi:hypothetical protein